MVSKSCLIAKLGSLVQEIVVCVCVCVEETHNKIFKKLCIMDEISKNMGTWWLNW